MNLNSQISESSPYDKLYIYYLNGRLENSPGLLGSSFIGNWEEGDTSFLFFSGPAVDQIDAILSKQPQLTLKDEYCMSYDDWHGEPLRPFRAGRFVVSPPWSESGAVEGEVPILLDPGVVFGVGNHPTTQDCLMCIDMLFSNHEVQSTVDLGTGTGVLAIAAARLGSRCNLAVDNNFLAARTARNNVAINHLEDRVYVACGKAENIIDYKTDLVIANIHYDVMRQLIESQGFLSKKWFILSGLLRSEARRIEARLSYYSANVIEKMVRDEVWHTFFGSIG
jgi:ribosomal protein L11 methyltransferase